MEEMKLKVNVKKIKVFTRRNGNTGQEIVIPNDNGYSVSLPAVDKEHFDFSCLNPNKEYTLVVEPEFIVVKGEKYYKNILTLCVVGVDDFITM